MESSESKYPELRHRRKPLDCASTPPIPEAVTKTGSSFFKDLIRTLDRGNNAGTIIPVYPHTLITRNDDYRNRISEGSKDKGGKGL